MGNGAREITSHDVKRRLFIHVYRCPSFVREVSSVRGSDAISSFGAFRAIETQPVASEPISRSELSEARTCKYDHGGLQEFSSTPALRVRRRV